MKGRTSACSICMSDFLLLSNTSRKLQCFKANLLTFICNKDIHRCSVSLLRIHSVCLLHMVLHPRQACSCISAWSVATSCPSFQRQLQGQLATANGITKWCFIQCMHRMSLCCNTLVYACASSKSVDSRRDKGYTPKKSR